MAWPSENFQGAKEEMGTTHFHTDRPFCSRIISISHKEENTGIGSAKMVLLVLPSRASDNSFNLRHVCLGAGHPDPPGQVGRVVLIQDGSLSFSGLKLPGVEQWLLLCMGAIASSLNNGHS